MRGKGRRVVKEERKESEVEREERRRKECNMKERVIKENEEDDKDRG